MRHRAGQVFVAFALLFTSVAFAAVTASPVAADCDAATANGNYYASSYRVKSTRGVRVNIGDISGSTLCSGSGVSHSATVCSNTSCDGWGQVGWRQYSWYSTNKGYCEFKPNASGTGWYTINNYSNVPGAQNYEMKFDHIDVQWECRHAGVQKGTRSSAWMGYSFGSYMPVQGEAHELHDQIGGDLPLKLNFTNMKYWQISAPWTTLDIGNIQTDDSDYGAEEPSVGSFRVWTENH